MIAITEHDRLFNFDEQQQAHIIAAYYYGAVISLPVMYWYKSITKVKSERFPQKSK